MPTYVDRHALADVPRHIQQQMHQQVARSTVDRHGVQPLAHWVTDGVIYCVVLAPDKDAFCRHHANLGLPCDDVHQVSGLCGRHPLSPEEMDIVRSVLGNLWPAGQAAA